MFPGAASLGDSLSELFNPSSTSNQVYSLQYQNRMDSMLGQGVTRPQNNEANEASKNSPQYGNEKDKPAPTEDPLAVEDRWTARLAKYAGIAGATGVKMGGL